MPVQRIIISMAVGMVPMIIVLITGLNNRFISGAEVASRTFSAFCFTGLVCFILMMSCEEYALYKSKKELEQFVDEAGLEETATAPHS